GRIKGFLHLFGLHSSEKLKQRRVWSDLNSSLIPSKNTLKCFFLFSLKDEGSPRFYFKGFKIKALVGDFVKP
ncbi:hypothetical protein HAX54_019856, partial [Datura stramonium]|nr:hypothetical protein [Datura stramonium]